MLFTPFPHSWRAKRGFKITLRMLFISIIVSFSFFAPFWPFSAQQDPILGVKKRFKIAIISVFISLNFPFRLNISHYLSHFGNSVLLGLFLHSWEAKYALKNAF